MYLGTQTSLENYYRRKGKHILFVHPLCMSLEVENGKPNLEGVGH